MQSYVFANSARQNIKILESEHPYSAGRKNYPAEEIYFPEAFSIEIVFDPSTRTEKKNDFISFYNVDPKGLDEHRKSIHRIGPQYSGTKPTDWPGLFRPLLLPYNRVWMSFSTDDHVQYWGYRIIATGQDKKLSFVDSTLASAQEFESSHPYMKETSVVSRIALPGQSRFFKIEFDARSYLNDSSTGRTSITFFRRNPKLRGEIKYPISFKYTGIAFPGVNGMPPLMIELENEDTDIDFNRNNRNIWFQFESDDQPVGWGWKFRISQCESLEDPLGTILSKHPEGMLIETNHPCIKIDRSSSSVPTVQKDYTLRRDVHFPGADAIALVFDPRSETNLDNSHSPDMFVKDEQNSSSFLEMVLLVKCFLAAGDTTEVKDPGASQSLPLRGSSASQFHLDDLPGMSKWVDGSTWLYGGGLGGKRDLMEANFPISSKKPVIIPADRFFFTFASLYSNECVQWGVRCVIYPLYNRPKKTLLFDQIAAIDGSVLITDETSRIGKDGRVRIKLPDTQFVQICFKDEETGCFNEDKDFQVKVFSGRPPKRVRTTMEEAKRVGTFRCTSGRRYFPGIDGYPALVLNRPNLWIDVLQPVDKGYKGSYTVVVAPLVDELADWIGGDGEIIDIVHPYVTPVKKTFLYETRFEDQWMEIAFDRRTCLGPDASVTFSSRHYSMAEFVSYQGSLMEGSYPTIDQPARIASSATVLTFISSADAHMVTYWGFRVAIRPVPSVDPSTPVAKSRKLFP
jgi:hypothetical protein